MGELGFMKKLVQKDKKTRKSIKEFELKKLVVLSIFKNSQLSKLTSLKSTKEFALLPIKSSKTRHVNRCVVTGRKKRINKLYSLSRISFMRLVQNGSICGLRNSSW